MNQRNRSSQNKQNLTSKIKVLQRKKYNCFCKIFCCKCMNCCQSFDFSLLTSEHRKNIFHSMIKEYVKSIENEPNIIIDPFFVLVGLLMGDNDTIISEATRNQILNNRANRPLFSKQDLELYIPQLCTYLVFHEQMQEIPIFDLLERTSRMDFHFAMKYFLYMKSLQSINQNSKFKAVIAFNEEFLLKIGSHFTHSQTKTQNRKSQSISTQQSSRNFNLHQQVQKIQQQQIEYKKLHAQYNSIFNKQQMVLQKNLNIFQSTLFFLQDLIQIGQRLLRNPNRKQNLLQILQEINKQLPAEIFLPIKSQKGYLKVGNIILQQCRVFQTKTRAPFYLCIEVFQSGLDTRGQYFTDIVSTTSIENSLHRSSLFEQDNTQSIQNLNSEYNEISDQSMIEEDPQVSKSRWLDKLYTIAGKAKNLYSNKQINKLEEQSEEQNQQLKNIFGESNAQLESRLKKESNLKEYPKYQLLHLMVKTQDDLRQESFAMQLLKEFNFIFKIQNLPIHVIPYEVVPLGHDCGIIQFLKDTTTLDDLRKKEGNLDFIRMNKKKRQKFMQTLVGYSLVNFFLQVKDRHNGNILIRRDGSIIHIDFGFFISNSPGKGVQLQKKVPFKITTQYIDTLGGIYSKDFNRFRKLFFKGYQACRKHQHRILILTKLMYSSHGTTMPCFQKGNQAISNLEERFNPNGILTDGDLSLYCQNLINQSIDNWRAKWYDKWQYYFQGILY